MVCLFITNRTTICWVFDGYKDHQISYFKSFWVVRGDYNSTHCKRESPQRKEQMLKGTSICCYQNGWNTTGAL